MQNSNSKTRIFECEIEDGQTMYFKLNRTKKTASVIFKKTYSGSVVIPATIAVDGISFTVTAIEGKTFNKCPCTAITIPAGVTAIGEKSFLKCTDLTSINVDGSNPNYLSEAGILFDRNKTTLIRYPQGKTGTYTIPDSVTAIGNCAFADCSGLTSVTIPDSVTAIGNHAFSKCSGLTSVAIPDSVTAIGNHAFADCYGLTSVTIPAGVTAIGEKSFLKCTDLTSINVDGSNPNYLSEAGILFDRNKTTLIRYPQGKTGTYTIPDSVTDLGITAFRGCESLTSVTIPDSFILHRDNSISNAFGDCKNLTEIHNRSATPQTIGAVFKDVNHQTCILYVPESAVAVYKSAPGWKEFANIVGEKI